MSFHSFLKLKQTILARFKAICFIKKTIFCAKIVIIAEKLK